MGMVTEWCENGSLADYLHDFTKPLFGKMCVELALEISQGMEYLQGHHNAIIHRDLKSDNILLGRHYEAKVADFGLTVIEEEGVCSNVDGSGGVHSSRASIETEETTLPSQPTSEEDNAHPQPNIETEETTLPSRHTLRSMLTNPTLVVLLPHTHERDGRNRGRGRLLRHGGNASVDGSRGHERRQVQQSCGHVCVGEKTHVQLLLRDSADGAAGENRAVFGHVRGLRFHQRRDRAQPTANDPKVVGIIGIP